MQSLAEKIQDFIAAVQLAFGDAVHLQALHHLKKGQLEEARRLWENHLASHPDDPQTLHHLALLNHREAWRLELQGEVQAAFPLWREALNYWAALWRCAPFWERLLRKMVDLATEQKGFDHFLPRFREMRRHLPEHLQDEAAVRRMWEEGLEYFFRHSRLPEEWLPLQQLGIPLGGADLPQLLKIRESLPQELLEIHFKLALIYQAQNRLAEARQHFQLLLEAPFEPALRLGYRNKLADHYLTLSKEGDIEKGLRFAEGIAQAERVLALDPENFWGLEFLQYCYHTWNWHCCLNIDVKTILNNYQHCSDRGILKKLQEALKNPDLPTAMKMNMQNLILNFPDPIVSLCRNQVNELLENVDNQIALLLLMHNLSKEKKEQIKNLINGSLRYGREKFKFREIEVLEMLLKIL